jgi:hypothetical protein
MSLGQCNSLDSTRSGTSSAVFLSGTYPKFLPGEPFLLDSASRRRSGFVALVVPIHFPGCRFAAAPRFDRQSGAALGSGPPAFSSTREGRAAGQLSAISRRRLARGALAAPDRYAPEGSGTLRRNALPLTRIVARCSC